MLSSSRVQPIFPVTDLARAKAFYQNKLGLEMATDLSPEHSDQKVAFFKAGHDTGFVIFQRDEAPKANHVVAGFIVEDFDKSIEELRGKGVKFEDYDEPGLKTENGVAKYGDTKVAWFKDPDGNLLSMNEMDDTMEM